MFFLVQMIAHCIGSRTDKAQVRIHPTLHAHVASRCGCCSWSLRHLHSLLLLPHHLSDHPAVPTARHLQLPRCGGQMPCVLPLTTLALWPRTSLPHLAKVYYCESGIAYFRKCDFVACCPNRESAQMCFNAEVSRPGRQRNQGRTLGVMAGWFAGALDAEFVTKEDHLDRSSFERTTPQKTRFRDVKYANSWDADWVDDDRTDYKGIHDRFLRDDVFRQRMIENYRDEEVCRAWDVLAEQDHTYHMSEAEYFHHRKIGGSLSISPAAIPSQWENVLIPNKRFLHTPRIWRRPTRARTRLELHTMENGIEFFLYLVAMERILVVFLRIQRKSRKKRQAKACDRTVQPVVYRTLAKTWDEWLSIILSIMLQIDRLQLTVGVRTTTSKDPFSRCEICKNLGYRLSWRWQDGLRHPEERTLYLELRMRGEMKLTYKTFLLRGERSDTTDNVRTKIQRNMNTKHMKPNNDVTHLGNTWMCA